MLIQNLKAILLKPGIYREHLIPLLPIQLDKLQAKMPGKPGSSNKGTTQNAVQLRLNENLFSTYN